MRKLLILAALVLFGSAAMADDHTPLARITVVGDGRAAAQPDMATLTLGVASRADSASLAMAQTSDRLAAIMQSLDAFGVEGRDVQTSALTMTPIYDNRSNGLNRLDAIGFEARNQVTLRLRDLNLLGDLLDAVLSDGANEMQGLQFALQDPEPLLAEARRNAVLDARRRAEQFAEAAGHRLGAVLTMTEAGSAQPAMEMAVMSMRSSAVPIAEGDVEQAARITVVYALE